MRVTGRTKYAGNRCCQSACALDVVNPVLCLSRCAFCVIRLKMLAGLQNEHRDTAHLYVGYGIDGGYGGGNVGPRR